MPDTPMRSFLNTTPDFDGSQILVTGGTGSFGRHFVKTVLATFKPKRIIVFSRDEMKQYEFEQFLSEEEKQYVRFFIGDVRDRDRLELAMREMDYVIHAAALKHVPAAEYNPFECVKTNIHGAENVVRAALATKVKKVIALSTDKASNPINLYGATKLASDKIFVAANSLAGRQNTRFAVVRYGNVVASRGSVIPYFAKLLADGATELPITDPRMTRFWITLQQGVDFVISSLDLMKGGEILVPKIPSLKMPDLVEAMAPGSSVKNVGIRPGEKLHEVMISEDDARNTIELDDRYVIMPQFHQWTDEKPTHNGAQAVADDFRYSSETNSEWLTPVSMQKLLKELNVSIGRQLS